MNFQPRQSRAVLCALRADREDRADRETAADPDGPAVPAGPAGPAERGVALVVISGRLFCGFANVHSTISKVAARLIELLAATLGSHVP